MTPHPPHASTPPSPQRHLVRWVVAAILILAIVGVGAAAVLLTVAKDNPRHRPPDYAGIESAARDGTVALLTYTPETVDHVAQNAKDLLTGDFLAYYTKFVGDIVAPAAKQQHLSTTATAPAVGVTSADDGAATVLLFVDQTTTAGSAEPNSTTSSVRVHLTKVDGRWLIDKFDPV